MKELKPRQIYWILGLLLIIIIGLALGNLGNLGEEKELLRERTLRLSWDAEETDITLEEILDLKATSIRTVMRSSSTDDQEIFFTGVPLFEVLEKTFPGAPGEEISRVIARAVDGYTIAYQKEEVWQEDNIYLVYAREGEWLKSREEGGDGPFMTVVLEDEFAQRWCKYLTRVKLE